MAKDDPGTRKPDPPDPPGPPSGYADDSRPESPRQYPPGTEPGHHAVAAP